MACPSRDRLARAALGPDPEVSDHLASCPGCRAELAAMRSVLDRLAEGHAALDRGHEEARERLLSLLPDGAARPASAWGWASFTEWMGGSTMRRGMVFGGLGTLGILLIGLLWLGPVAGRASAMDVVAEAVRRAKSYQFTMSMMVTAAGKAAPFPEGGGTISWLAPGSFRIETKGGEARPGLDQVMIFPASRPGVLIDMARKTYQPQPARLGQVSPLMMVDALGAYSGRADRDLGEKAIDGVPARGFVIDAARIDPDANPGTLEIWVDPRSNLPTLIRYEMDQPGAGVTLVMDRFRWDVDLPAALFDPTPPEGFAEVKPPPSKLDDTVAKMVEGLKIYARYSGGHYPRVKMLYGDVTRDELVKLSGAPYPPRSEADSRDERVGLVSKAVWGFSSINTILRDNADAAYHGKAVGPGDKDKVLLRWKADDGGYHVLFGDLRFETMDSARLRVLEGKPAG